MSKRKYYNFDGLVRYWLTFERKKWILSLTNNKIMIDCTGNKLW